MMLAGVSVAADSVAELARSVRTVAADEFAGPARAPLDDQVKLLALAIDERAIILNPLEGPGCGTVHSMVGVSQTCESPPGPTRG